MEGFLTFLGFIWDFVHTSLGTSTHMVVTLNLGTILATCTQRFDGTKLHSSMGLVTMAVWFFFWHSVFWKCLWYIVEFLGYTICMPCHFYNVLLQIASGILFVNLLKHLLKLSFSCHMPFLPEWWVLLNVNKCKLFQVFRFGMWHENDIFKKCLMGLTT